MKPFPLPHTLEVDPGSLQAALAESRVAVLDFEASAVAPHFAAVAGLGVYLPESRRVWYINVGHLVDDPDIPRYTVAELRTTVQPFLGDPERQMVAHNATYELRLLAKLGVDVRCRVSCTLLWTHRGDECLRSDGSEPTVHPHLKRVTYGLKELMVALFGVAPPRLHEVTEGHNPIFSPPREVGVYCACDVVNTWSLYHRSERIIAGDQWLRKLLRNVDDPNNLPLARMMAAGIQIDAEEARRQRRLYQQSVQMCREAIWDILDINWPLDTPAEINRVLRHLGLRSETSDRSVGHEALLDLFHEVGTDQARTVLALLLSKAQMEQRIDAFLYPLPEKVRYTDGRLFPERFASTLATTRFASSPNLQNLPGRADKVDEDDLWRAFLPDSCDEHATTRNVFTAKPGHILVSCDLSAAEPRYLALLFQRALLLRDGPYGRRRAELHQERMSRYPALLQRMYDTRTPEPPRPPERIEWPDYDEDPLWGVFKYGKPFHDPYDALLATIDREGYTEAVRAGRQANWLEKNRWRGKKAFLALAYGSRADTLAPALKWTVERTQQAIDALETTYATLRPLRELTLQEMIHLGEVRTLWNRPRRINGYYQLARPDPLRVCFYRMRPVPRRYVARIIPLGSTVQGVQSFVQDCWVELDEGRRGELVLAGNPDGSLRHISQGDPFAQARHFNQPPFRNLNFAQIEWVQEENGLRRFLARQSRGLRQAFNSLCQATGADHLRWLMNAVDEEVCGLPEFGDCRLILTLHDSLIFEVPAPRAEAFIRAAKPVISRRPYWSDIDFKVKVETGTRFGEMK
jgi:DNA polymerase I-like protein with 3'-5' exonuclease and polymerase domains